jgi:signal transduction histidine kinase/ligand-binding sensor domain-containing protein
MPIAKLTVLLHVIAVSLTQVQAQLPLSFSRYTIADGLPDDHILCALVDRRDFIWFGTEYGLSRFDGKNFLNFYEDAHDRTSLSSMSVAALKEDPTGNIWVGTLGGALCLLNPYTAVFEHMTGGVVPAGATLDNLAINDIYLDGDHLWVATYDHGLGRFNKKSKLFEAWFTLANDSLTHQNKFSWNTARSIAPSKCDPGVLWLGASNNGLVRFDKKTEKLKTFPIMPSKWPQGLRAIRVLEDEEGFVWVATLGGGLCRFDPASEKFKVYPYNEASFLEANPARNLIHDVCLKGPDEFWVASPENGFGIFNLSSGQYRFQGNKWSGVNWEAERAAQFLFHDNRNRLWVFGEKIGARLYDLNRQFFNYYYLPSGDCRAEKKVVSDFAFEPNSGQLFIATLACGCYEQQPDGEFVQRLSPMPSGNFQSVQAIAADPSGSVWLGAAVSPSSPATLLFLEPGSKRFEPVQHSVFGNSGLLNESINEIFTDAEGTVWLATQKFKLYKINPKTMDISSIQFKKETKSWWFVTEIEQGENGHLWIGLRNGGLLDFDPSTNDFDRITEPDILYNRINSLEPARDGGVLVSMGDLGLIPIKDINKPNEHTSSVALEGLIAYKIESDENSNIWVTTKLGLGVLDSEKPCNNAAYYSSWAGIDNTNIINLGMEIFPGLGLLLGQENGFLFSSLPLPLPITEMRPAIIVDFKILGHSAYFEKSIGSSQIVKLAHYENFLTFQFTVPGNTSQQSYDYFLEGFDKNWILNKHELTVTYSNLKPGNYTFHVRPSSVSGKPKIREAKLEILINPAWWQTVWLRMLAIVGLFSFAIRYYYNSKLKMKLAENEKIIETERLRTRIAQDIHDEVGSSLTKISLGAQVAARLPNLTTEELKNRMEKLGSYSRNAASHLREIIFSINPDFDNFQEMQSYFRENASDFWSESNMNIHFDFDNEQLNGHATTIVSPDIKRQLLLIFKEAQNNVAKHGCAQNVWLTFKMTSEDQYLLEVADDGKGVNPAKQNGKTHGLKGMMRRADSINAQFSITSTAEKGTKIKVQGKI